MAFGGSTVPQRLFGLSGEMPYVSKDLAQMRVYDRMKFINVF